MITLENGSLQTAWMFLDRLRSVVMIFNRDFVFQSEFGYRGDLPQDLIVPDDIALDLVDNRVFVAQAANKGVGVYRVILTTD